MLMDLGIQLVDHLYDQLKIDEQWSLRRERSVTWWGYRLAQHIEVGLPHRADDLDHCIVRIWTEVARDVDPITDPASLRGQLNRDSTMSALIWNPATGTIVECCTAIATSDNTEWLWEILQTAAVLQNASAHRRAHAIAEACNGRPAGSNHPTSGERPDLDDMLKMPDRVIAPLGAEPSRFTGSLTKELGELATEITCSRTADETSIHCEVPYTGDRPYGPHDWNNPGGARRQTALVRIFTDRAHPRYGNGALMLMHLPVTLGAQGPGVLANHLNAVAAHGGVGAPLLGAWCVEPIRADRNGLVFCSFLPNTLARPGLLENQIIDQAARAKFALRQLGTDPTTVTRKVPR